MLIIFSPPSHCGCDANELGPWCATTLTASPHSILSLTYMYHLLRLLYMYLLLVGHLQLAQTHCYTSIQFVLSTVYSIASYTCICMQVLTLGNHKQRKHVVWSAAWMFVNPNEWKRFLFRLKADRRTRLPRRLSRSSYL